MIHGAILLRSQQTDRLFGVLLKCRSGSLGLGGAPDCARLTSSQVMLRWGSMGYSGAAKSLERKEDHGIAGPSL